MNIKQQGWQKALTDFIRDDIDGRFWFDDMVRKVVDGTIKTDSFQDYVADMSEETNEESFEAGREIGYDDGYNDCHEHAAEKEWAKGYREGYNDGKEGVNPIY